ncbi:uncharacterized protein [Procambarus clarkii]|uniref:uncharacterized protein n=1 Tax=Procambarus clarkii TaxID=6728 RepID=UPI00374339AD
MFQVLAGGCDGLAQGLCQAASPVQHSGATLHHPSQPPTRGGPTTSPTRPPTQDDPTTVPDANSLTSFLGLPGKPDASLQREVLELPSRMSKIEITVNKIQETLTKIENGLNSIYAKINMDDLIQCSTDHLASPRSEVNVRVSSEMPSSDVSVDTSQAKKSSGFSDSRNSATQASRSSTVGGQTEGTTTGAPAATGTPPDDCRESWRPTIKREPSFLKVTTRPRPAPASSPPPAPEATTPHCGKPPGGEGTGGTPETQAPAPAGTCTSATTNRGDNDSSGATPSTPEDPQSLKSPTSAQAVDERLNVWAPAGYRQSRKQIQKHGHH